MEVFEGRAKIRSPLKFLEVKEPDTHPTEGAVKP